MTHLTYLEAAVVGLIQGVTELFPVSSLGHNVLIPALIGGSWARDLNVSAWVALPGHRGPARGHRDRAAGLLARLGPHHQGLLPPGQIIRPAAAAPAGICSLTNSWPG
jgi:hypothetical protein